MNPARPFAHWESRNHRVVRFVNYRYVAGAFVADEYKVPRRFSARHDCACEKDAKEKQATHG
jgi:hypothetical protein